MALPSAIRRQATFFFDPVQDRTATSRSTGFGNGVAFRRLAGGDVFLAIKRCAKAGEPQGRLRIRRYPHPGARKQFWQWRHLPPPVAGGVFLHGRIDPAKYRKCDSRVYAHRIVTLIILARSGVHHGTTTPHQSAKTHALHPKRPRVSHIVTRPNAQPVQKRLKCGALRYFEQVGMLLALNL